MKSKLVKFNQYISTLLPHETAYLLEIQQFADSIKHQILIQAHTYTTNPTLAPQFDESLDKRKYSSLKAWIQEKLEAIDVDAQYAWIAATQQAILNDSIEPIQEKAIFRKIKSYVHPIFFFRSFYEMLKEYRHFLLVRMRYADHHSVDEFLSQYAQAYVDSVATDEKIHVATKDIVDHYSLRSSGSNQWEEWLKEVYYNPQMDGLNRYLALIRLIFIAFNYRKLETLSEQFEYQDKLFRDGTFYSKRLLINYYSNRLLFYSKLKELEQAEYFGRLSLRYKTHDFLYYTTNLAAILLRLKKYQDALVVMKRAYPDMKETYNYHNKLGYIAFYVKCLNKNQQFKNAENFAVTILKAFRKEIFEYRWHLFFTAYLESLLNQQQFKKIIKVIRQQHLLDYDQKYKQNPSYLPSIPWYYALAQFKEGLIEEKKLTQLIESTLPANEQEDHLQALSDLIEEIKPCITGTQTLRMLQQQMSRSAMMVRDPLPNSTHPV